MPASAKSLRTCPKGHRYYKSSDCPACPVCEAEKKPESGFLSLLSAPARRALEAQNIGSLEQLAGYSVVQIMALHGIGKTTIPRLEAALKEKGLSFRK